MNKNKGSASDYRRQDGFIGIGLILAIVLGIAVVGGGAYYLGKSSKVENKEVVENKLEDNQNLPVVDNSKQAKCDSNSIPSITVLSPNGGEVYTVGQNVTFKWKTCNVPSSVHISAQIIGENSSSESLAFLCEGGGSTWGPECLNDGEQRLETSRPGIFKINISTRERVEVSDMSDNYFTINSGTISASQKCIDTATSLLPAYISKGELLDLKLNKVEFFASNSDTSGSQYFTGNPTKDACMVSVSYSIKPKPEFYTNRLAGNGHESSDGWIINKSGYATIDKNSSGYYVSSMGTGY